MEKYISNALEKFGRWASIAVEIWNIIAMLKSLCIWLNGLFLVKKLTKSHKQTAKYALSPTYYLLKSFNKEKTKKNEGNIDENSPIYKGSFGNNPTTDNNGIPFDQGCATFSKNIQRNFENLEELRESNRNLPSYTPEAPKNNIEKK